MQIQFKSNNESYSVNTNRLPEKLSYGELIRYKNELSRISFNQAIVQENGLFTIYNVKESDVDRIVRQIRDLDFIA